MQTKDRQSNFELLRIIAMFMILLIHANNFSLGIPTVEGNRQLISFLLAFYLFQSVYGWITDAAAFIKTGYSVFSFMA